MTLLAVETVKSPELRAAPESGAVVNHPRPFLGSMWPPGEMRAVECCSIARHRAVPERADDASGLVDALRRREPTSVEHLIERYGKRAHRLAARITGNAWDAEEVVQDALWTVVRKIDTFRRESAFGSWLYRIVANAAYQKVRRRNGGREREVSLDDVRLRCHEGGGCAEAVAEWFPAVEDPSCRTELRAVLSDALDALAPDYRVTILLYDVEGLSTAQIADRLALSVANVKTRVHRARVFLRERLAEHVTARRSPRPRRDSTPAGSLPIGDGTLM